MIQRGTRSLQQVKCQSNPMKDLSADRAKAVEEKFMLVLENINRTKLDELVSQLPPQHQELIQHLLEGETSQEISTALSIPTATVRKMENEAIFFMKGIVSNFGLVEDDYRNA